jgi:anti-sigma regulatory factor (Ser/Thr protein kinase)
MDVLDLAKPAAWLQPGEVGELRIYETDRRAAALARAFARDCVKDAGRDRLCDDAEEVISELATNAIVHAPMGGMFAIVFKCQPCVSIFDVLDRRPDLHPPIPDRAMDPPSPGELSTHGRGLLISRALTYDLLSFTRPAECGGLIKVVRAAFL